MIDGHGRHLRYTLPTGWKRAGPIGFDTVVTGIYKQGGVKIPDYYIETTELDY